MKISRGRAWLPLLTCFALARLGRAEEAPESIEATTFTNTRAEINLMATWWETDTVAISPLATAQYPQYSGDWQYIFPNNNRAADGDIHVNMAVTASGTGKTGNNLGTASPIVGEVVNVTDAQISYLSTRSAGRYSPRGIFRFYTEHGNERHFEIHPMTQLLRWNGTAFVADADYRANITTVPDGSTHASSTYTSLLNGSQTINATIASNNVNVNLTYPSGSVNYVEYAGTVLSGLTSDAVSSYFVFRPTVVPTASVKCRLVSSTGAATTAATLVVGQSLTVNALTRTEMAAIATQISGMTANQSAVFPRPIEFITLGLTNLGAAVTTGAASGITSTAATLNGSVIPNGVSTSAYFQYGLTTNYGSTTSSSSLGSGSSAVNVVKAISGLALNSTYHFRLVATNSRGTAYGADHTFTNVQSPSPTITTQSTGEVANTTAAVSALVNPNGFSSTVRFEYGTTTSYGTLTSLQNIGGGTEDVSVGATLSGLQQDTLYHFRTVAANGNGTTLGADKTFSTAPRPPTATTSVATNVTSNSASLNGSVNAGGLATTYHFDYGLTTGYGTSTSNVSAGSGTSDQAGSTDLASLQPNTLYHFRIVATNSRGTVNGADQVFTTLALPPGATTNAASEILFSSATLNGTIMPNGVASTVYFEYGLTPGYGSSTTSFAVGASGGSVPVNQALADLLANTTYHFRVVVTTNGGTAHGADLTFTTALSGPPTAGTGAATSVGLTSAALNAIINGNSAATTVSFEYGLTTGYGSTTTPERIPDGSTAVPVAWALNQLKPNTTYHFRVAATNVGGTVYGANQSFTTATAQQLFVYPFDDVTTTSGTSSAGGTAGNVTYSNFRAIGTSLNPNATGRFSFTNQPLGATNGSDVFTGGLDAGKYFEMTVTPLANFSVNVSSIGWTLQRSGTGIRQYSVRSEVDSYATNLGASISPANPNLSIVATPLPNIFQVTDASTTANLGSNVASAAGALAQPLTFRFYGFNAEASGGTFSVDDVALYGAVSSGGVPTILPLAGSDLTTQAAVLNANVDPRDASTTTYFLYGTDTNYANITAASVRAAGSGPAALADSIAGLISYTTYHFRVVAVNGVGVALGPDQVFTTVAGDRDGDGMPDDWEVQNGLNPDDPGDADLDSDGDGFTNQEEFIAGTDPQNAVDRLRITAIAIDGDSVEITFTSVPGKVYQLEATNDLAGGVWEIALTNINGNGTDLTVVDEGASALLKRNYRVRVVP